MSAVSLAATGVRTKFSGTAPVGDKEANFEGTDNELFPHFLGGIHPSAVLQAHVIFRNSEGRFLAVSDIVDGDEAGRYASLKPYPCSEPSFENIQ